MVDTPVLQLTPQYLSGKHNSDLKFSADRLLNSRSSVDLSTVCIIPNSGLIPAKVAENWLCQTSQMNQKFLRLMAIGMENNDAYNSVIEQVLASPGLNEFKYVLTLEENTIFPLDGLVKLFESVEKYDVVGGLSWSRGVEGRPMIYGDPKGMFHTFTNVAPLPDRVQPCLAVGTGFTLFKLSIFKDERVPRPWFRKEIRHEPGKPVSENPDMYFFQNIHMLGYKVACDTRIRVGHYDPAQDVVW